MPHPLSGSVADRLPLVQRPSGPFRGKVILSEGTLSVNEAQWDGPLPAARMGGIFYAVSWNLWLVKVKGTSSFWMVLRSQLTMGTSSRLTL